MCDYDIGVDAVNHAPPPAPAQAGSGGSMLGGIGSTIAQGMWRGLFVTWDVNYFTVDLVALLLTCSSLKLLSLFTGLAFGTGSAVAHRAVDAVVGPRTIQHETVASEGAAAPAPTTNSLGGSDACGIHSKAFQDVWNSSQFLFITSVIWQFL